MVVPEESAPARAVVYQARDGSWWVTATGILPQRIPDEVVARAREQMPGGRERVAGARAVRGGGAIPPELYDPFVRELARQFATRGAPFEVQRG